MQDIIYLILRQIRRPALILLSAYSVAILGMVLIPAVDENGQWTHLTFFQAFYWVSYTATTIGYGEIPSAFSEWQRVWVVISIYYTVPAWFYAVGKIIALLQNDNFQYALNLSRFERRVARLQEKFCIICGFGEAGLRLTHQFLDDGFRCVIIEKDAGRLAKLARDARLSHVLAIVGDADNVDILEKAGIRSPYCRAVLAITDNEAVNLKVTLTARLLSSEHRHFKMACRTYTRNGSNQAKALTTDIIINTNRIFTEQLLMSLRRPSIAQLHALFNGDAGTIFKDEPQAPEGRWIICGHDALGKTLKRFLEFEGVDYVVIDPNIEKSDGIKGLGNEAVTLREARIDRATAIVCARNSDSENLSIALTAKTMHPAVFVIGRQNKSIHRSLFAVAGFDRVMEEAELIVDKAFPQIARPVLSRFLALLSHQDEQWGRALLKRLQQVCGDHHPHHLIIRLTDEQAPAVLAELASGRLLRLQTLWTQTDCEVIPLLLIRQNQQEILLPDPASVLQKGDKILLAFNDVRVARTIKINLRDAVSLYYTIHNKQKTRSFFWRYLDKRFFQ